MYTIEFTSTSEKFVNLSLKDLVVKISEHFAYVGADFEPISIIDSESGEVYEIICSEGLVLNYKFYFEHLDSYYNILELVDLLPYL